MSRSSPHILPVWFLPNKRHGFFTGRSRTVILCVVCALLGYCSVSLFAGDGYNSSAADGWSAAKNHTSALGEKLSKLNPWATQPSEQDDEERYQELFGNRTFDDKGTLDYHSVSHLIPGKRTRIGKCTILFGDPNPTYERALRTHEAHNRLHGYPLLVLRKGILDDVWTKPAYILSLLLQELEKPDDQRLEWLLWVDADTIILNPYIPIEVFLPPTPEWDDTHILITHDWNGLNNGVFPVRVHPWSVELFSAILAFRHYRPDYQLTFRDQSAMDALLKEERFARSAIQTPQRWFNGYQGEHNETLQPHQVRRGDFLVHFAGVGHRQERMQYWLERAEMHKPDWELEVQHTSYPEETRDFWEEKRHERDEELRALDRVREELQKYWDLMEQRLQDYRGEVSEEVAMQIQEKIDKAKAVTNDPNSKGSREALRAALMDLETVAGPLNVKAEESNRALLKQAHDVIYSAEQSAISGLQTPETGDLVRELDQKIVQLKQVIVQTSWRREEVTNLISEIDNAENKLREKIRQERQKIVEEAAASGNRPLPIEGDTVGGGSEVVDTRPTVTVVV